MVFDPQTIVKEKLRLWCQLAVIADEREMPRMFALLRRIVKNRTRRDKIVAIVKRRRAAR